MKKGKLVENGVRLYDHERMTVEFFLERGEDIELLKPSYRLGSKNADLLLCGKVWEIKSPKTTNKNTIMAMMKRAIHQSDNLIVDLRRLIGDDVVIVKLLERKFMLSKSLRNLLIITKNGELVGLGAVARKKKL